MLLLQHSAPCIIFQWDILLLLNKWPFRRGLNICCKDGLKKPKLSFAKLSHSQLSRLEHELSLRLLTEVVAAFPQQQSAEDSNDAQVEEEAEEECPHGPEEGGHHAVGGEHGLPWHHVCNDGLHLKVCPHHSTDVEELVAVACQERSVCELLLETCTPWEKDVGLISSTAIVCS